MLNFGRYLERLGLKTGHQPVLLDTAQPVAVVSDLRQLVSPILGPSGIFGGTLTAVPAEFTTLQVIGASPAWLEVVISSSLAFSFAIQVGIGDGPPPPTLSAGATELARHPFANGGDNHVFMGSTVAAAGLLEPSIRIPTQNAVILPRIFKPAGGWANFSARIANAGFEVALILYEHPTETPQ